MITAMQDGVRLAYVVRRLEGVVKRMKMKMVLVKKGQGRTPDRYEMKRELVDEDAGYMVYFPRGHAMRIPSEDILKFYKLHLKPRVINMQGLSDPNSPLGKMMMAQDEASRHGAMMDMERMVIQLACAKTGPQLLTEQSIIENPSEGD